MNLVTLTDRVESNNNLCNHEQLNAQPDLVGIGNEWNLAVINI